MYNIQGVWNNLKEKFTNESSTEAPKTVCELANIFLDRYNEILDDLEPKIPTMAQDDIWNAGDQEGRAEAI
jgi:hypothetical protein